MLRITRQADHAIVLMTFVALDRERPVHNARDLAELAQLPQPTVTKVLKALARAGILASQRGVKGGYRLARRAEEISLAEIIAALEGPPALIACADRGPEGAAARCARQATCPARRGLQAVGHELRASLEAVSLRDLAQAHSGAVPR